jgi:hypothetical protein
MGEIERADFHRTDWAWTTRQAVALGLAIGALFAVITVLLLGS